MFALVRIDVMGRKFPRPWELATQTDLLSEAGLRIEESWFGPDRALIVVLGDIETPGGISQFAAAVVNGSPLDVAGIVRGGMGVELADDGRAVIGYTRQQVLGALPPGYATCPNCRADLTIEDHRRPPCPSR